MIWFHPTCFRIFRATYEPSEEPSVKHLEVFAGATKPVYQPLCSEHEAAASTLEGLLSKHTAPIMQNCFSQELLERLPLEILLMISELIGPCWYLTVLGESRRLIEHQIRDGEIQDPEVDISRDVWMSRVNYRGNSYVVRLSNTPLKPTTSSRVSHVKLPREIQKIVLSTDSIGLRGVQFLDDRATPTRDGSPWYEILDAQHLPRKIHVNFDGLFVREVRLAACDSPSASIMWSSPYPPTFHSRNFYACRKKHRLHYMELGPQVQGLLVCSSAGQTIGIHAFSGTNKPFQDFLDSAHQRVKESIKHWIYFPLNSNERISGAWVRKLKMCQGPAASPTLVLRTCLGRTVTFGTYFPSRITDQLEYYALMSSYDGCVSGLFHDGFDPAYKFISEYGVTCDDTDHSDISVPPPLHAELELPEIPPGRGSISSTWYMTKVSLRGLTKVQVCRDHAQAHQPYVGFLMFYEDGHMEASGQIRWDYGLDDEVSCPVVVKQGVVGERGFIRDIRTARDNLESEAGPSVWQLPETGFIVWWFSHLGDMIEPSRSGIAMARGLCFSSTNQRQP
ncbi:uncharacterized protein BO87DRAFT_409112 [Aspergillus neoniger CBS 115656]|uniref:Uncharacterized protein n=1 Tax=Aspergillus neoniger (strain CBS 115656) TaxID=1448310 RepID=A0A318YCG9_ASPNB|nr:hypothetical protein BO87DRAFT_409112 [Aspergillus neoniger CBS 115656]PYH31267.1 hypothetical protein BO87DRAFT_409112 [Aspergillus neoniger CBS 115656]